MPFVGWTLVSQGEGPWRSLGSRTFAMAFVMAEWRPKFCRPTRKTSQHAPCCHTERQEASMHYVLGVQTAFGCVRYIINLPKRVHAESFSLFSRALCGLFVKKQTRCAILCTCPIDTGCCQEQQIPLSRATRIEEIDLTTLLTEQSRSGPD